MPLATWGFMPGRKFYAKYTPAPLALQSKEKAIPTVLYHSEKCRVMFQLEESGYGHRYGTFIYYGRLHAPEDMPMMEWGKENHYCWHTIENFVLPFLEGISAGECVKNGVKALQELTDFPGSENVGGEHSEFAHDEGKHLRELVENCRFENSDSKAILAPLKLHKAIWRKYGNRLFNLFDLRDPEQWSKYTQFIQECYDIRGGGQFYMPDLDKIC